MNREVVKPVGKRAIAKVVRKIPKLFRFKINCNKNKKQRYREVRKNGSS
jgi:hypothetical protein